MQLLFDFFPLILFFVAYKWYGIFVATGVAIAGSIIQVSVHWLRNRRFETAHLTTLGVIAVFGGLTLIFRDDTFIKWKPTIVNWIFAAIVLASLIGQRRTVLEFLLGKKIHLPVTIWRKVNLAWGLFFSGGRRTQLLCRLRVSIRTRPAGTHRSVGQFQGLWLNGPDSGFCRDSDDAGRALHCY